jgi:hypothetical protein
MVLDGIPRVCFYICSTERNSELFSLPLMGSKGNSESMLLILFHGTEFRIVSLPLKCSEGNYESLLLFLSNGREFRVVFCSAEEFGTEFRGFSVPRTAGIPSEITIRSVYSVFRGIIFFVGNSQPYLAVCHFFTYHTHSYRHKILFIKCTCTQACTVTA